MPVSAAPSAFARLDAAAFAATWQSAKPFPHVIIDDFLPPADVQALREAVARTPHYPNTADFYEMMASSDDNNEPAIAAFRKELADPGREFAERVTGKRTVSVDLRSYVYLAGSYLLPHNDAGAGFGRVLAWTLYLLPRERCTGGELEFFECEFDAAEIVATRPAKRIEPVENRLVLFDVSPASLHQVREVTDGGRISLSGWFVA